MWAKVKGNKLFQNNKKKEEKNPINFTQINKVSKIFLSKNLITILSLFKTISSFKILQKNHKITICKKDQGLRKDMKKISDKIKNGNNVILTKNK